MPYRWWYRSLMLVKWMGISIRCPI
jgi:hypothetical protein